MTDSSTPVTAVVGSEPVAETAADPPKWLLYVLLAGVAALWALGAYVSGDWPRLLAKHPTRLILLSNRYRFFILTAPKVDLAPHLIIGIARSLLTDPLYFAIGYFYGERGLRAARRIDGASVDALVGLFGKVQFVLCAFFAGPYVCVLAGAARMSPKRFFALNLAGTTVLYVAMQALAEVANDEINSLLRFNLRNNKSILYITIGVTLVTVLIAVQRWRRDPAA